ncbi:hypothetical protein BD310DRAFT_93410 [Dichomitus squalens]|uniref:Transcription factor CBF/NF-Y/archaeal histone domain-containing protein n=1 Tax=Dichomitus squalens TaxID=114155 RepID=A0A4Q9Q5V3_9APHY|nr:hypothetical protein BD310DRAFT_93410 [Dichomitus squalens]
MALSFTTISGNGRHSLTGTTSGFNSDIDEEEIDQLDSGLDDEEDEMEPEVEEESISTSKGRRKLGVRVPGTTLIPQDRLDNMLQAEGAGPHMSKEAIYMLSIATEEFVKRLAEAGYEQTVSDSRQHVQYKDMSVLPQKCSKYKFLEDTIPRPISIAEAMERRAAKERELLEDDPAISATAPPSPSVGSAHLPKESASTINPYTKGKARQSLPAHANGKQANGAAGASVSAAATPTGSVSANAAIARSSRARDRRGRWSNGPSTNGSHEGTPESTGPTGTRTSTRASSARTRNRSTRAREAAETATPDSVSRANGAANGMSASTAGAHEFAGGSGPQDSFAPSPGQTIGPASGYLDGGSRLSTNGHNPMTDNPGRTIYSQQRPPSSQR